MGGTVTLTQGFTLPAGEALTTSKINRLAAELTARVDEGAVGTTELADGSIPIEKLDASLQTQVGVEDGSIGTAKLAAGCLSADATGRAKMADGFVTADELADGAVVEGKIGAAAVTAGKLATGIATSNAVGVAITNAFTLASGAWRDITGLTVTITPSSASSKILILAMVHGSTDGYNAMGLKLVRGVTDIGIGDEVGNRLRVSGVVVPDRMYAAGDTGGGNGSIVFLDSPGTTSACVYKVQAYGDTTVYIGRGKTDSDSAVYFRGACTLVAVEMKG
jgi:hypothetical protein